MPKKLFFYHIIQKSQFNIQMLFRNLIDFYSQTSPIYFSNHFHLHKLI